MIRLKRRRDAGSLHRSFTGAGLSARLELLVAARVAARLTGNSIEWKGPIAKWGLTKPALKRDSFDKCAYCEASTAVVAHGDVEHFRPKSIYWWLALCVDNYVFACQLCNQTYKGDSFPIRGERLTAPDFAAKFSNLCPDPASVDEKKLAAEWMKEDVDLPHPYLEDPERLFAWTVIETSKEVLLVPRPSASGRGKRAAQAVEDHLGLNREQLRKLRYEIFKSLKISVRAWKRGDRELRQDALEQIKFMCQSPHQFAGMCRYFAHEAGVPLRDR